MIINIGSKNSIKIKAIEDAVKKYNLFSNPKFFSMEVDSGVHRQPKSLKETIKGAMKRSENSFEKCDYSFGIESGLMEVPYTKSGYMDVTACAIYDGKNFHLGLSSSFEYPTKVTELVLSENIEIDEAMHKTGLTENKRIGYSEGVVGFLTKGRVTRKDYTEQAVIMALIHLENPELFKN
jgi:inosine/xanthosine triphosphatase